MVGVRPQTGIAGFEGQVVFPGDPDYDARRAVWNAMHDRRPAVVHGVPDRAPRVVVRVAGEHDLPLESGYARLRPHADHFAAPSIADIYRSIYISIWYS